MVTRTRPDRGGLVVVFSRDGKNRRNCPLRTAIKLRRALSRRLPPAFG
jgi:hypothetical protein